MANKTLEQLPDASSIARADSLLVSQSGNSREASVGQVIDTVGGGWGYYADAATALEANAISITASQRTLLTIDGGTGSITDHLGTNSPLRVNNKHTPGNVGESYTIRLDFFAKKASSSTNEVMDFEHYIGGSVGDIMQTNFVLRREAGVPQRISLTWAVYCMDTYVQNGGEFYVTATANIQLWRKAVFIRRDYLPQ